MALEPSRRFQSAADSLDLLFLAGEPISSRPASWERTSLGQRLAWPASLPWRHWLSSRLSGCLSSPSLLRTNTFRRLKQMLQGCRDWSREGHVTIASLRQFSISCASHRPSVKEVAAEARPTSRGMADTASSGSVPSLHEAKRLDKPCWRAQLAVLDATRILFVAGWRHYRRASLLMKGVNSQICLQPRWPVAGCRPD